MKSNEKKEITLCFREKTVFFWDEKRNAKSPAFQLPERDWEPNPNLKTLFIVQESAVSDN